jgi:hypothetical protein
VYSQYKNNMIIKKELRNQVIDDSLEVKRKNAKYKEK